MRAVDEFDDAGAGICSVGLKVDQKAAMAATLVDQMVVLKVAMAVNTKARLLLL